MENSEIWISCYHFHPVWSGPAERFARYAKYFKENGLEPKFYTIPRKNSVNDKNGFPVGFVGTEHFSISAYFKALSKKALEEKPAGIIVLLADWKNTKDIQRLKSQGIPVIYVNTMVQNFSNSKNFIKRRLSNYLNRKYLNAFSSVVCSSDALRDALIKFGVTSDKVEIIPNGVDLQRFKAIKVAEKNKLKKEMNLPLDKPLVLFVGSIVERKGVLELVKGWKYYKQQGGDGVLLLVGDELRENKKFEDFYKQWDELVAKISPEDEKVKLPPSESIENYFQVADMFVFLSKKEGMPNVLGEAMACQLPVLLTPFDGFSDAWGNENENFWMIKERTPEVIAEKLKGILLNPEERERVATRAYQHIKRTQNLERSIERYIKLIEYVE